MARKQLTFTSKWSKGLIDIEGRSGTNSNAGMDDGMPKWLKALEEQFQEIKGYMIEYSVYCAYALIALIIGGGALLWLASLVLSCCRRQPKTVIGEICISPCTLCVGGCKSYCRHIKLIEPVPEVVVVPQPPAASPQQQMIVFQHPPAPVHASAPQLPFIDEGYQWNDARKRFERV